MKSSNVLNSAIDFILDSLFEKQKKVFNEGLEKIVNQNRLLSDKSYSAYGFVYKGNLYVLKSVLEYVPSYLNKKTVPQLDNSLYDQIELLLKNQDKKENDTDNGNDVLKGFLDHSFLIDYLVLDSLVPSKREQKKKMAKNAVLLLTEEIRRIVDLLLSAGIEITDEELLNMIAKEIKKDKSERLVGIDDVKKKFKNAMEEYLERAQEYL